MKRLILLLFLLSLSLIATCYAEQDIPARYEPILQEWNATSGEELHLNILEYWRNVVTDDPGHYIPRYWPLKIRFGGTTKELIADKKNWDLAIVSSKDVDLQALIDKKLITVDLHYPYFIPDLYQWLLPDKVKEMLPPKSESNLLCLCV